MVAVVVRMSATECESEGIRFRELDKTRADTSERAYMRCGGAWFIVVEWQSAQAVAKRVAKYSYNWGKLAKTGSGK